VATIDELPREHDEVVTLISHVRDARRDGDIAAMAGLARRITAVLVPHTQVEEHGMFPATAREFPDHIAALEAEHRRVEAVLGQGRSRRAGRAPGPDPGRRPDRRHRREAVSCGIPHSGSTNPASAARPANRSLPSGQ
jgi:hypothetical protein